MADINNLDIIIKPDVIIDYIYSNAIDKPAALVYVRPETNEVHYEKAIILGIMPYADVVYLANLNGKIFIKDALILDHYPSQYRFAVYGKDEMAKYPEFIEKFEKYFDDKFEKAQIMGSFDALIKLGMTDELLFNIVVDKKDFLKLYGQTIKKINNIYILNYDMPAIIKRYTPKANVFVIAVKFKDPMTSFMDINQSIFERMKENNVVIEGEGIYKDLEWNEIIRRTYHISKNHIMAMFDMIDFVIRTDTHHIEFHQTPLGRLCIEDKNILPEDLYKLKDCPLVYVLKDGKRRLVNLIEEANEMSMEECSLLIKNALSNM